jgi:ribosome-associated heat shock protein Hsp15
MTDAGPNDDCRIDVWLHRARFAKTRTAAGRLVAEGAVSLQRPGQAVRRIEKASDVVRVGDCLAVRAARGAMAIEVLGLGEIRGRPIAAGSMWRDLTVSVAQPVPDTPPE